jgi:hypothetical protein
VPDSPPAANVTQSAGAACWRSVRGIALREHDRWERRGRYDSWGSHQEKIVRLAREAFLNAEGGSQI